MHYLITGGTGLIGRAIISRILSAGHDVTVLTRSPARAGKKLPEKVKKVSFLGEIPQEEPVNVIINLAGEPISKRWTKSRKYELINSRLSVTRNVINYIINARVKPDVLISGSAIGYYGNDPEQEFTEQSNFHECFTHEVCKRWETEALGVSELTRVCLLRIGIVLSPDGGALSQMLPAFKLGLGGVMGSGDQWMSWVHIDDLIGIIEHIINHQEISGPVNATSPNPVTNREFTHSLGRVLHRPTLLPMPGFVLKILFGEMAKALLLRGQKVIPEKLTQAGYEFKHPDLQEALADTLK